MTVVKFSYDLTFNLQAKDRATPLTCQQAGLEQLNQGFPLAGHRHCIRDVTVQVLLCSQPQRCARDGQRPQVMKAALLPSSNPHMGGVRKTTASSPEI